MLQPHLVVGSAFTIGDSLFTLFTFALLLVLIRIFAWKPLMNVMKEREEHIASEIDSAEESRSQAEKLLDEQREVLKQARVEAQTMIENAKQLGEKEREEIIKTSTFRIRTPKRRSEKRDRSRKRRGYFGSS